MTVNRTLIPHMLQVAPRDSKNRKTRLSMTENPVNNVVQDMRKAAPKTDPKIIVKRFDSDMFE